MFFLFRKIIFYQWAYAQNGKPAQNRHFHSGLPEEFEQKYQKHHKKGAKISLKLNICIFYILFLII